MSIYRRTKVSQPGESGDTIIVEAGDRLATYDTLIEQATSGFKMNWHADSPDSNVSDQHATTANPWNIHLAHDGVASDGYDDPSVTATYPTAVGATETATHLSVPSLQPWADASIQADDPNANFGSNPQMAVRDSDALGQGRRDGYLWWDFTSFDGWTANSGIDFRFEARTNGLVVSTSVFVSLLTHPTSPGGESTVTWNNPPAWTTSVDQVTVEVLVDALDPWKEYTVSYSVADTNALMGKWVVIAFGRENDLVEEQILVASKENLNRQIPLLEGLDISKTF